MKHRAPQFDLPHAEDTFNLALQVATAEPARRCPGCRKITPATSPDDWCPNCRPAPTGQQSLWLDSL